MREISSQDRDRGPYTYFEVSLDYRSAKIISASLETDASLNFQTPPSYLDRRELAVVSMLLNKIGKPDEKHNTTYALNYEEVDLIGRALLRYEHFDVADDTFARLNSRFKGRDNVELREIFERNRRLRLKR